MTELKPENSAKLQEIRVEFHELYEKLWKASRNFETSAGEPVDCRFSENDQENLADIKIHSIAVKLLADKLYKWYVR